MKGSLRLILFGSLVLLPIIVAAVVTVISIRLYHKDKELYVYDLSAQSVELVARNLATRLESLRVKAELEPKAHPLLAVHRGEGKPKDPTYRVTNISKGKPRLRVNIGSKGSTATHLTLDVRPEALLDLRGYSGPTTLMVVNRQGYVLVHPEQTRVAKGDRVPTLLKQLKPFSRRGTHVGTREVQYNGLPTLAAFARVGSELAVLQTLDKAQVGAAARPLVTSAVVASVVVVAVAVLVALLLGSSISRPLRAMARQAEAIGRGEFGGAVSTGQGAAEMSQLTASFNAMSSALQKRDQELLQVQQQLLQSERLNAAGRMIAAIAKEISDPLESCFTLASQTRQRLPESSSLRTLQKQIMDEANKASNILQNLARLSSQEETPVNAIEPDMITSDVLVSSRPLFDKRQIQVVANLPDVGKVMIGPEQLRNALLDIFLYVSGKAMSPKPVQVGLQQEAGMMRLDVTFGGTPLSEEERGSLLQPAAGETALELAVAAMVFEEKGGKLVLEPTEDGNRIVVTLPVVG